MILRGTLTGKAIPVGFSRSQHTKFYYEHPQCFQYIIPMGEPPALYPKLDHSAAAPNHRGYPAVPPEEPYIDSAR